MKIKSAAETKELELSAWMRGQPGVLVAYSGGVDSAYLSYIATRELGEKAICVTGVSPSVSAFQLDAAIRIARAQGFNHRLLETNELSDNEYRKNDRNRCYYCKSELYSLIGELSKTEYGDAPIVDGTNADDEHDIRPGKIAANENGVMSPLSLIGITKLEIRERSRAFGLETWDKPAGPCLASRVAGGVPVTIGRLARVEKSEAIIRELGFKEFRVRVHKDIARIEIAGAEMGRPDFLPQMKDAAQKIKDLGFRFVALDLEGFRSGSLSEIDR